MEEVASSRRSQPVGVVRVTGLQISHLQKGPVLVGSELLHHLSHSVALTISPIIDTFEVEMVSHPPIVLLKVLLLQFRSFE
jgi:hypothetical protein